MKVTVRDCLKLAPFASAKVVAGSGHLDNQIKKVSVLEANNRADVAKFCSAKNQMVLTSFFGVKNDEDAQCSMIKELAKGGNSALVVFHVGEVVKYLSDKVIVAAENAGLPLITLPEGNAWDMGDVIGDITGNLFFGKQDDFENSLINNTIFHLLNFEKYSDFKQAARAAALSNDFQLILLSEDFNPVLSVETRHRTTIDEAIKLGKEREVGRELNIYTMIDVNGVLTYWGPVTIQDTKYFMFIVDNEDSYTGAEITKLAEIIELAMGMWKYTPQRDVKAEFIKALRRGNTGLAYTLKSEASVDEDDVLSVFYAKGVDTPASRKIIDEHIKNTGLKVFSISEEEDSYGLILKDKSAAPKDETKTPCGDLYNKLKEDKGVNIFHATGIDGITGAGDAYRLINETWSFCKTVFPYKRVFTKYEMVLLNNCINIQLQGGYIKKNYDDLLEHFKTGNKGRQLLETLETFVLDAGMNSGKTAEFMDIHANTVQYRLKKINDILGVEITGNRVIPGLTVALALQRLERVVR